MKKLTEQEQIHKDLLLEDSMFAKIKSKFGKGVLSISGAIDRQAGQVLAEEVLKELRESKLLSPFENITIDLKVSHL